MCWFHVIKEYDSLNLIVSVRDQITLPLYRNIQLASDISLNGYNTFGFDVGCNGHSWVKQAKAIDNINNIL